MDINYIEEINPMCVGEREKKRYVIAFSWKKNVRSKKK